MNVFPQEDSFPAVSDETIDEGAAEMVESREQFIERALSEYESPLVGYAMGFVHDVERARDIVQETFIRLCQQDLSRMREGLKTWLFTVCRNRALDVLRKEARVQTIEEHPFLDHATEDASPDRVLDEMERLEQVMRYLGRLPENQRTVILMKFRDGASYQEICEATGLSSGNVGYLIHMGLKRLRELLPEDIIEPTRFS